MAKQPRFDSRVTRSILEANAAIIKEVPKETIEELDKHYSWDQDPNFYYGLLKGLELSYNIMQAQDPKAASSLSHLAIEIVYLSDKILKRMS